MIGTIMAVASGLVSAAQAVSNFQKAKKAEKQAITLGNQANAAKIADQYAAFQAPDIASAQYNETMRQATQATQALQGMGPEGAGQIANLNQSVLQQNAQTAAEQAKLNFQRDQAVAEGRNQNAQYEYSAKMNMLQGALEGAQGASTAGRQNAMGAIAGGIEGIGAGLSYDYGDADKVWNEGKKTNTGLDGQTGGKSLTDKKGTKNVTTTTTARM
jgi:hypothetical protein